MEKPFGKSVLLACQPDNSQSNEGSLPVLYNLLTEELLVSGYPLATLPLEYERHPIYQTLIGPSSVEAIPSAVPGMLFSSKKKYGGYTIHFGLE